MAVEFNRLVSEGKIEPDLLKRFGNPGWYVHIKLKGNIDIKEYAGSLSREGTIREYKIEKNTITAFVPPSYLLPLSQRPEIESIGAANSGIDKKTIKI